MGTYVMALDQGTTSSRAILFDAAGRPLASAQEELPPIYPQPGWVEQNPNEILGTQLSAARSAIDRAEIQAKEIAALGIANQRETTIVWDRRTGEPVGNAIVWQCRRTAGMCDELTRAGWAEPIRDKTGLVIDPYFSATKVRWILDNVTGAQAKAERGELAFGTVDSWLIYRLTGGRVHVTDPSNASRTMLYNIHTLEWDAAILSQLRIPPSMLPEVRLSSEVYGATEPGLLGAAIPIAASIGDQQGALFGQACFARGMAKNTYGTGCFLLMNTGGEPVASRNGLLTTIAWGLPNGTCYALEGSVFVAGAAVQWLRDGLGLISTAAESETLAASVPDTGGVYLVPAFVGLGAPHWDASARGAIVGLTRGTSRAHIVRAALEAMAYQTADVLQAMEEDLGARLPELRVDGGAAANDFLLQFQADILGAPVVRPKVTETTALGAAYLAGLAVGVWSGTEELAGHWAEDRRFTPDMPAADRGHRTAGWRRAVERSRNWAGPDSPTR
ncbi:MAG: glycerol kinase GlpK [Armatimonadetes bacterium]|nr:glycerol kinase GlpK [Armatimonadota bacterium]